VDVLPFYSFPSTDKFSIFRHSLQDEKFFPVYIATSRVPISR